MGGWADGRMGGWADGRMGGWANPKYQTACGVNSPSCPPGPPCPSSPPGPPYAGTGGPVSTLMLRHFPWLNRITDNRQRVACPITIAVQMTAGVRRPFACIV